MLNSQVFGLKGFIIRMCKGESYKYFLINTQKLTSESFQTAFEKISTFLKVDLIQKELSWDSDASVVNIKTIVRKESILL